MFSVHKNHACNNKKFIIIEKHPERTFNGVVMFTDLRQMEDMDISPGSTPTEESMMEQRCASLGQTPSYLSHTPSHHKHPIISRLPSVSPHMPASASVTPTSTAMLHSVSQSNDKSASESLLMQKVNNQQITQQGWFITLYSTFCCVKLFSLNSCDLFNSKILFE